MKKMMVAAIAIAIGFSAHAMAVDWKYNAAKDSTQTGLSVYVILGDTAKTDWASVADIAAEAAKLEVTEGSVAHGSVKKAGSNYYVQGGVVSDLISTKSTSYYYVLVNQTGDGFKVSEATTAGIYDPGNQESGTQQVITSTNFAGEWKSFSAVPEPTSGLLLLLGVAGLALRRRRA